MAETKRRNRTEGPGKAEDGAAPPRRQTQVTLSKDVSSKYRKIMPKSPAGKAAGPQRPRRKPDEAESSAPPARSSQPPRTAGGRAQSTQGRGGPPARRPGRGGPSPHSRNSFSPAARRYDRADGGRAELEMKAIINRELPTSARQIRETQALIMSSAESILALAESLEAIHQELDQALSRFAQENRLLEAGLSPLRLRLQDAKSQLTTLYEKVSFHDLAGQRLAKVESFCVTLSEVLNKAASRQPRSAPGRTTAGPDRAWKSQAAPGRLEKAPAKSRERQTSAKKNSDLKGPQAQGDGLDQSEIDRLLSGL